MRRTHRRVQSSGRDNDNYCYRSSAQTKISASSYVKRWLRRKKVVEKRRRDVCVRRDRGIADEETRARKYPRFSIKAHMWSAYFTFISF